MVTNLGMKGFVRHANNGSVVLQAHSLPSVFNPNGLLLVLRLIRSAGPSAILRAVSQVVVATFDGEALRGLSHVLKERFEAIKPARAHGNPSAAVRLPLGVIRVSAAALGMLVRFQRWAALASRPMAMSDRPDFSRFVPQASATFSLPTAHGFKGYHLGVSAITEPFPRGALPRLARDCYKSAISLACHIKGFHGTHKIVDPHHV